MTRRSLEDETKSGLVEVIETQKADKLYLELLKDKVMVPHTCGRTFPLSEKVSYEEDDEVVVMGALTFKLKQKISYGSYQQRINLKMMTWLAK